MNITDQLRAGVYPNCDFRVELGIDLTASQYRAVLMSSDLLGLAPAAPFVPPFRIAGILQNAPDVGQEAIVRYFGWSLAVYGDIVAAGDLLKTEGGGSYDRLVPFVMGTDGHNHAANSVLMESVLVQVVDLTATPVTGLTSADITARQWYRIGGTISEHAASTSVTEDGGGGGWYAIATTDIVNLGSPHRLSIEPVDPNHIITPSDHQWTPRNDNFGPPVATSFVYCMGQALTGGIADAVGLMMLRPQLF